MPGLSVNTCPECGQKSLKCIDSRPGTVANVFRRRRWGCELCGFRGTTHERWTEDDERTERAVATALAIVKMERAIEAAVREAASVISPDRSKISIGVRSQARHQGETR